MKIPLTRMGRALFLRAYIDVVVPLQIRVMRYRRGWTQKHLGSLVGMSQSEIARVERIGFGSKISIRTLHRVSEAFDCAISVRYVGWGQFSRESLPVNSEMLGVKSWDEEYGKQKGPDHEQE